MKYEVNAFLKNHLVLSWSFRSLTQVAKFLEFADMDLLDFHIYKLNTLDEIDPVELMKIWKIDRY